MQTLKRKSWKFPTGFTIIEMLVVISVIAILASILLPAISTAQKKAKVAKTQAMIDSKIAKALTSLSTDSLAQTLSHRAGHQDG